MHRIIPIVFFALCIVFSSASSSCLFKSELKSEYYSLPSSSVLLLEDQTGTFRLSVCDNSEWYEEDGTDACADSAVCYTDENGDKISFGTLSHAVFADLPNAAPGIEITYGGGDTCYTENTDEGPAIHERKAVIQLVCDPSLAAFVLKPTGMPAAIDQCTLFMQVNSSHACPNSIYCDQIAANDATGCTANPFCKWDFHRGHCRQVTDPERVIETSGSIGDEYADSSSTRYQKYGGSKIFAFFANPAVIFITIVSLFLLGLITAICACIRIRAIDEEKAIMASYESSDDSSDSLLERGQPRNTPPTNNDNNAPTFVPVYMSNSMYDQMASGAANIAPVAYYGSADDPLPNQLGGNFTGPYYYVPSIAIPSTIGADSGQVSSTSTSASQ